MNRVYLIRLMLLAGIILVGCQKDINEPTDDAIQLNNNAGSSGQGPRLSYGDTLFFLKNLPGSYSVLPVSRPSSPGYFKAIPLGLALDSVTGRINVTQSETGLRYKIYYVSGTGAVMDSVRLVISGIDYKDAIYEIAATPNAYDTAFPIYNARPEIPLPCGDDDEDDDGDLDDDDNTCVFDETDLDADGNDDIPGVIQDKLLVDIKKGTIDVEASFHAGIFGSSNPANGLSKDFTFYYRLQDASNRALNRITVRVYHYKKRSDIPQALLDTLNLRNNISYAVNNRANSGSSDNYISQANSSEQFFEYSTRLELATKPKRPPIIIIVSQ
jgi:hypothetical protein